MTNNPDSPKLQQALDQANRALDVEAALDHVRIRILGMRTSVELTQVSKTLFDQFQGLGFSVFRSSIVIEGEGGTVEVWIQGIDYGGPEVLRFSRNLTDVYPREQENRDRMLEARAQGLPHYTFERAGEQLIAWYRRMKELFGFSDEWFDSVVRALPESLIFHNVFFTRGRLLINSSEPLSDSDLAIAKRFADLFGFAYDRFLELRELEIQAKQAKRNAAVDRLRLEAMAMTKTDDIADLVKGLWEGLTVLGLDIYTLVFQVEDRESGVLQIYHVATENTGIAASFRFRQGLVDGRDLYLTTIPISLDAVQDFILRESSSTIDQVSPAYASRYLKVIW